MPCPEHLEEAGISAWVGISRFGSSHDRPSPGCWDDTFQKVPDFIGIDAWNWARTISLKRSTQNLQLSTATPADYPIYWHLADIGLCAANVCF